jgi:hypothetical protein
MEMAAGRTMECSICFEAAQALYVLHPGTCPNTVCRDCKKEFVASGAPCWFCRCPVEQRSMPAVVRAHVAVDMPRFVPLRERECTTMTASVIQMGLIIFVVVLVVTVLALAVHRR